MKKVLSKKQFCSILNRFDELDKASEKLTDALQSLADDVSFTGFVFNYDYEVKCLEELLEDTNQWLSWWIFEAKDDPENHAAFDKGKKFILRTPEDLYDFLYLDYKEYDRGSQICIDKIRLLIKQAEETNKKNGKLKDEIALLKFVKSQLITELQKNGFGDV